MGWIVGAVGPAIRVAAVTPLWSLAHDMEEYHLDCRGLHPPEPFVRIIEQLDAVHGDFRLTALLERRPIHLFPELEERGLRYGIRQREDGLYELSVAGSNAQLED